MYSPTTVTLERHELDALLRRANRAPAADATEVRVVRDLQDAADARLDADGRGAASASAEQLTLFDPTPYERD